MVFYRKLTLIWPHVLKVRLKALILNGLSSIFFEMIRFWFPLLKFLLYTWKVFLFHLMMSEKKGRNKNPTLKLSGSLNIPKPIYQSTSQFIKTYSYGKTLVVCCFNINKPDFSQLMSTRTVKAGKNGEKSHCEKVQKYNRAK